MKRLLLLLCLNIFFITLRAQYIHKIKADSVLITNDSCNAELNLENSTRHVKGFLFNKGNGRTEFRKAAVKLNDSTYIIGADTLTIGPSGSFIRNQFAAAQAARYWIGGPARVDNSMIISVPDTGASTHPYSYTHTPSVQALRLGTNDVTIPSLTKNALISFGRHYGAGIMIYDNLDTKVDCFGIGIVAGAMQFYGGSAWNPGYFTWTTGGYQPTLGTNEIMRLKNNGNLMLGTTNDNGRKLHVNGTGYFTDTVHITSNASPAKLLLDVNNTASGSYAAARLTADYEALAIRSNLANGFPGMRVYNDRGNTYGAFSGRNTDKQIFIVADSGDIAFWTGNPTVQRMTLTSNGNVGISTQTPAYKLDVNGKVAVRTIDSTATATNMLYQDPATGEIRKAAIGGASGGAVKMALISVNDANYTVGPADYTIIMRNQTAIRTLTLPAAANNANRVLVLVNGSQDYTVSLNIPVRLSTSYTLSSVFTSNTLMIQSDGTDWWRISTGQ